MRIASGAPSGQFHFSSGGADISNKIDTWNTGGWQTWSMFTVPDVILTPEDKKLRFYVDAAEFNLSSFEFIEKAPLNSLPTQFFSAHTFDINTVQLNINKPLAGPLSNVAGNFDITVDGTSVPITEVELNTSNKRILFLDVDHVFKSNQVIKISYAGSQITAVDGVALNGFFLKDVENTIPNIHQIPGRVEAEDYFYQLGVELESTTDAGGGQNVGYLDAGDYMDYYISVPQTGIYDVKYRTASENGSGQIKLQTIEEDGTTITLHTMTFQPTGGWQIWQSNQQTVYLTAGVHQLRVLITQPQFNLNWMEFISLTHTHDQEVLVELNVFPNPVSDHFLVQGKLAKTQNVTLKIFSPFGQLMFSKTIPQVSGIHETVDLTVAPSGHYTLTMTFENGNTVSRHIVKIGR